MVYLLAARDGEGIISWWFKRGDDGRSRATPSLLEATPLGDRAFALELADRLNELPRVRLLGLEFDVLSFGHPCHREAARHR